MAVGKGWVLERVYGHDSRELVSKEMKVHERSGNGYP
jgi:hypothetical protein